MRQENAATHGNLEIHARIPQKPTTLDEQRTGDASANDTHADVGFSVPDRTIAPTAKDKEANNDASNVHHTEDNEESAAGASDLLESESRPVTTQKLPLSASTEIYPLLNKLSISSIGQTTVMEVTKRVRADELRRRARRKRRDLAQIFKTSATVPLGNASTRSDTSQQAERTWMSTFAELEELDEQIENCEYELVQAEAVVESMLSRLIGSEPDNTFECLEEEGIHFRIDSSESSSFDRGDADAEMERPPEQRRLLEKLDEFDFIMDQLLELRGHKELLQGRDDSELASRERLFLEKYESSERQLKTQLQNTRAEMDDLRNTVQQLLSLEDERQSPSDGDPASSSVGKTRSEVIHLWLEGS